MDSKKQTSNKVAGYFRFYVVTNPNERDQLNEAYQEGIPYEKDAYRELTERLPIAEIQYIFEAYQLFAEEKGKRMASNADVRGLNAGDVMVADGFARNSKGIPVGQPYTYTYLITSIDHAEQYKKDKTMVGTAQGYKNILVRKESWDKFFYKKLK